MQSAEPGAPEPQGADADARADPKCLAVPGGRRLRKAGFKEHLGSRWHWMRSGKRTRGSIGSAFKSQTGASLPTKTLYTLVGTISLEKLQVRDLTLL